MAEDPGISTPELVIGPQDLTTATWIGGYPEGSQAGPVPVSTSGLGSSPMLANVAFPDSILLRECAPHLHVEAEPDWEMEIREKGLGYHTTPPQLMLPTGISTLGVFTVPVTDYPLGSSALYTSAAGPEQDKTQQTETRKPSLAPNLVSLPMPMYDATQPALTLSTSVEQAPSMYTMKPLHTCTDTTHGFEQSQSALGDMGWTSSEDSESEQSSDDTLQSEPLGNDIEALILQVTQKCSN